MIAAEALVSPREWLPPVRVPALSNKGSDCVKTQHSDMDRYLIETPHDAKDCVLLVQQVYAMGYLTNFEWGCKSGVHSCHR